MLRAILFSILGFLPSLATAQEATVSLRNGMVLGPGLRSTVSGVDQAAYSNNVLQTGIAAKPILVLDDNLRQTYVRSSLVQNITDWNEPRTVLRTANVDLRVSGRHPPVAAVQRAIGVTPFDDFGRRLYVLQTIDGPVEVLQGITEVSAQYLRVESLDSERPVIWDMRLSPSAVDSEQLKRILYNQIDRNNPQNWLDIVSVYSQGKRYGEARQILYEAIERHPELENLRPELKQLQELNADRMFDQARLRREAGQFELSMSMLESVERKTLSIETQVKLDQLLRSFREDAEREEHILAKLEAATKSVEDSAIRGTCDDLLFEIRDHISPSTLPRFADLLLLPEDAPAEQVAATGFSGWLLGAGRTIQTLPMLRSVAQVRSLVRDYCGQADPAARGELIEEIQTLEAGNPRYIAAIAGLMRPPLDLPPATSPGVYSVDIDVAAIPDRPATRYQLALPPEYDPNRKYPCVLSLPGEYGSPEQQLLWWSGQYNEQFGIAMGEASRHGYIVVVPEWRYEKQPYYHYTENEHARVLACLRDAMRRTSIDTDRVFISGHHMGGDAAWDIALAHPDLWAGAIIIGGDCREFSIVTYENAKYVPFYVVVGELDGAPSPMVRNGRYLDRMLDSAAFDCMLTVYKGRGHDHFQEELPRIMEWMNLSSHRRNVAPQNFEVKAARPGDNFYWFLEVQGLTPKLLIQPLLFETKGIAKIEAALLKPNANGVRLSGLPAESYRLLLGPEHVNLDERIIVQQAGRNQSVEATPSVELMLEDLRRRVDRQHPFWIEIAGR